jgi:hypothetical protein
MKATRRAYSYTVVACILVNNETACVGSKNIVLWDDYTAVTMIDVALVKTDVSENISS